MTPKEKAQELVDKFRVILIMSDTDAGQEILCTTSAKNCALIAVDELIEAQTGIQKFLFAEIGYLITSPEYWEEVKQEIEKL